mmetsp:Transcript_48757/g.98284  ORF Transcript_48757/g.98284 Transcript_48757/m.98284 type:complete len:325 (+) Transcript_48757:170-1144(+)
MHQGGGRRHRIISSTAVARWGCRPPLPCTGNLCIARSGLDRLACLACLGLLALCCRSCRPRRCRRPGLRCCLRHLPKTRGPTCRRRGSGTGGDSLGTIHTMLLKMLRKLHCQALRFVRQHGVGHAVVLLDLPLVKVPRGDHRVERHGGENEIVPALEHCDIFVVVVDHAIDALLEVPVGALGQAQVIEQGALFDVELLAHVDHCFDVHFTFGQLVRLVFSTAPQKQLFQSRAFHGHIEEIGLVATDDCRQDDFQEFQRNVVEMGSAPLELVPLEGNDVGLQERPDFQNLSGVTAEILANLFDHGFILLVNRVLTQLLQDLGCLA